METKTLFGQLETKFAVQNTDTGLMSGYGSVFGNVDAYGDIVAPGAFTKTIAEHKANGTMPMMLLGHNFAGLPIGAWDSMEEDAYGLKLSGHFLPTSVGQDARTTAALGEIKGLSIGFVVTDFEVKNGNRIITGAKVFEISLVTMAANDLACVGDIKSKENTMSKELTVAIDIDADAAIAKVAEIKSGIAELQLLLKSINITMETKDAGQEGNDCEEDEDCEDGCQCGEDGTCESEDPEGESKAQKTKYEEAAITAISELRDWAKTRLQ